MPLRNATPVKYKPRGLCDTYDGMNVPAGAMSSLQNLIADTSTPFAFQCRPALTTTSTFPGFSSPGVITWALEISNIVYGFVPTSRNSGKDEPFVYNLLTNTFLTVRGITASNVPTTPASTGDWVTPSATNLGPYIVFTHPGFTGSNGYFGYFDISNFTQTANGNTTNGSTTITGAFPISGIQPGYLITGSGIPTNTTVTNVANVTQTTTGNTNSNTSLTSVGSYIPVGSAITGTGIPAGTTVTNISGAGPYTVTISQAATATATGISLFVTGTTLTLSAAATATANAVSLTVAGGSPTSPLYASGNTTMNGLPGIPTFCDNFYNRIYFVVSNTLYYTDTLSLNRTLASQSLTAGDSSPVTALSLFTLTTTTQGILQGLLAFKSNTVFQITGDAALNTLAINSLNTAAGTVAPNSVTPTPDGVFFVAPDGVRVVQADGTVSEPDQDVRIPFINALYPTRMNASYNSDVYRICVQRGDISGSPWQEYWYDLAREIWTGPHTCQQDIALPNGSGWICFSHLYPATMFSSYAQQFSGQSFTEYGSPLTWVFATSPIGEEDSMYLNCVQETTINMLPIAGQGAIGFTASDENTGVLGTATYYPSNITSVWGAFLWGAGLWYGSSTGLRPHLIPWTTPLIFTKMIFQATGASALGFKVSNLRFTVQPVMNYPSV